MALLPRTPLLVANWKMHGNSSDIAVLLEQLLAADRSDAIEYAICPPFPYIFVVAERLLNSGISLGAQDASEHITGAYTGEVAASMLADSGCHWVIVGHSECRRDNADNDNRVAEKVLRVQEQGLCPILCVGENLAARNAGIVDEVIQQQLCAVNRDCWQNANMVIAYEPVWAIGTGNTATPSQVQAVHQMIRQWLTKEVAAEVATAIRILYGGSINADNAAPLFALSEVDGGLVGGASLQLESFMRIANAAAQVADVTE